MEELTQDTFTDAIKGKAVIDFWAPWCGPCKMFAPIFEEVAAEKEGITFAKVNTEEQGDLAGEHGIRSIPTLLFFEDGKEIHRQTGGMDKDVFAELLDEKFD